MNKVILLLLSLTFSISVFAQSEEASANTATIKFTEELHEFGDIYQGDKVKHTFKFENTGKAPLILTNIGTTCGCTAPEWTREPIGPGETGEIVISFNSTGKSGIQNKVITVFSNASNPQEKIKITANVLPPKQN